MMHKRKLLQFAAADIALGFSGIASADPPAFNWNGFYIGGAIGGLGRLFSLRRETSKKIQSWSEGAIRR